MVERRPVDVVVLGLVSFQVLEAVEVEHELELVVETTAAEGWCRECGVQAAPKDRRDTLVRDVDAFGRPTRLRWRKRRFSCPEVACPARTWSEQSDEIRPRAVLTERARRQICRRVGRDGHSVAAVARDFGIGWHTVMRAVMDYDKPLVVLTAGSSRRPAGWSAKQDALATLSTDSVHRVIKGIDHAA